MPKCPITPLPPYANSCRFSLPSRTAPASLSLRTTCASCLGTKSLRTALAAVVFTPAVSSRSLTARGIPCSGPFHSPRVISASAFLASASADSAVTVMYALRDGLNPSIRSRHASVSSTGEIAFVRTSCAASERVKNLRSFCAFPIAEVMVVSISFRFRARKIWSHRIGSASKEGCFGQFRRHGTADEEIGLDRKDLNLFVFSSIRPWSGLLLAAERDHQRNPADGNVGQRHSPE